MIDLATVTVELFEPLVGTPFVLSHPDLHETFTLVGADRVRDRLGSPLRDPFTLLFHGGRTDIQFDQQTLPLVHDDVGAVALFLVPVGRNEDGTVCYQAVFN